MSYPYPEPVFLKYRNKTYLLSRDMEHFYPTYSERLRRIHSDESAKRNLKRLKIALMIWAFSLLGTIAWFTSVS